MHLHGPVAGPASSAEDTVSWTVSKASTLLWHGAGLGRAITDWLEGVRAGGHA